MKPGLDDREALGVKLHDGSRQPAHVPQLDMLVPLPDGADAVDTLVVKVNADDAVPVRLDGETRGIGSFGIVLAKVKNIQHFGACTL